MFKYFVNYPCMSCPLSDKHQLDRRGRVIGCAKKNKEELNTGGIVNFMKSMTKCVGTISFH